MHPFTEQELLTVWERGCRQHPVDRALTLLMAGFPEITWEELCDLSVGRRDMRLVSLRESMFGPRLESSAECSQCKERLEFVLDTQIIRAGEETHPAEQVHVIERDEIDLRFRLPNSWDLAAVAPIRDSMQARTLLMERCLIQATRGGEPIRPGDLSEDLCVLVAEQMVESDPGLEILLDFECPACGARCPTLFDIVTYFWEEIEAEARRLLREIHTLARAYGWRESEILAISPVRRYYYLALVQ
jgi:hypothetical protein